LRSARPGEAAAYTVTLVNPAQSSVTYDLSVRGVSSEWVEFVSQVTIAAGQSVDLDLALTSSPFAALAEYGFVVVATTGGVSSSVEGTLALIGEPALPDVDPQSHGVVLALAPSRATAGQGTAAHYVVRLTNTGSVTDTFTLSTELLPAGFVATFGQDTIEVPPGASNFREAPLTLVPPAGTAADDYAFQVVGTSIAEVDLRATAAGVLTVVASGVDVELTPNTGEPESTFELVVTNTGTLADTFHLAIAAPAALAALLEMTSVTLQPGESRTVPIEVGQIDFAFPGTLALVGMAVSMTDSTVMDADTADVAIAGELGVAARFDRDFIELPAPGMTSLLLFVENIGNLEDAYSATITGTTGPFAASLTDLDGTLTQTVPLFRLPGLSRGAILVTADLTAFGTGTLTVLVRSLTDESISATATATLRATSTAETGSIRGFSYVDVNNNGLFDASERRLLGTRILLLDEEGNTLAQTFSDLNGAFRFDGLAAGTYTVQKVQPPLYLDGRDTPGSLGDADTQADQFTFMLPPGGEATDYLFGERSLLPWYIGKTNYLSSTPFNHWENLDLTVTDLWLPVQPQSLQMQTLLDWAGGGGVSVELFDHSMRPMAPQHALGDPRADWSVTPGETYYLRLSGTSRNVDLSLAFSDVREAADVAGDLDGNGRVDQADLDLVLLNWGRDGSQLDSAWRSARPSGRVGQAALDAVLLSWGR
jgi:hypothetical protein